jgi:hypothetical protein
MPQEVYLIDHLREQGFEPQESSFNGNCDQFDLVVPGVGAVSVCLYMGYDFKRPVVHLFDANKFELWVVNLSAEVPDAVVIAVVDAAAWELSAMRGGPVTPAQTAQL